jgi:predicted acetyltransferase
MVATDKRVGKERLELVDPAVEFRGAMLSLMEEFTAAGEDRYKHVLGWARDNFAAYVRRLEDMARGMGLPPGQAPQTTFWLVRDRTFILGTTRLRHHLTPALRQEGGHIGYNIRPLQRGKGYGTRQLALTLEKARRMALSRVLVTCNTDNLASARVIEKNGGQLAGYGISPITGKQVSRYWIELV